MTVDLSIVLYKPRWDELKTTLASLDSASNDIRHVRILISGTLQQHDILKDVIRTHAKNLNTVVTCRFDNLGFAGGHNFLLHQAFGDGAEMCLVYNPDVYCEPGAIEHLVRTASAYSHQPALFGPTLIRGGHGGSKEIDSAGINWSASGRHYDIDQGKPWRQYAEYRTVTGLTGACLLVTKAAFGKMNDQFGELFDSSFVAFREDAELGVRAASSGVPSVCIATTGFRHSRGNPGTTRSNELVNMLSVQNRFLMRWKLGYLRPGNTIVSTVRDIAVIAACLFKERTSLPGVVSAARIRRFARYSGVSHRKPNHANLPPAVFPSRGGVTGSGFSHAGGRSYKNSPRQ